MSLDLGMKMGAEMQSFSITFPLNHCQLYPRQLLNPALSKNIATLRNILFLFKREGQKGSLKWVKEAIEKPPVGQKPKTTYS